jgi:hypothetical protein
MFKKEHVIPFLLGWLVMAFFLPPTKLLGSLGGKKSTG